MGPTNVDLIPPPAPHWQELDLAEILSRPAAFCSISQSNSLYRPGGLQYAEGHDERGSLEATVRAVRAARNAPNFVSWNWIGYSVFRQHMPQNEFDRVQYAAWSGAETPDPATKAWDDALVDELRELVEPGDNEFQETGLQCAFTGTALPLELARKRVETIVLAGIHLDWCVEGNARAARDHGYLPIVLGDASACASREQESEAFRRINEYFAPVITVDRFVELLPR